MAWCFMKLVCLALDVTSDLRQQRLKMCLQTGRSMDPINFDMNSYGLYSGSNASICYCYCMVT